MEAIMTGADPTPNPATMQVRWAEALWRHRERLLEEGEAEVAAAPSPEVAAGRLLGWTLQLCRERRDLLLTRFGWDPDTGQWAGPARPLLTEQDCADLWIEYRDYLLWRGVYAATVAAAGAAAADGLCPGPPAIRAWFATVRNLHRRLVGDDILTGVIWQDSSLQADAVYEVAGTVAAHVKPFPSRARALGADLLRFDDAVREWLPGAILEEGLRGHVGEPNEALCNRVVRQLDGERASRMDVSAADSDEPGSATIGPDEAAIGELARLELLASLTPSQAEIAARLEAGETPQEIAAKRGTTVDTIYGTMSHMRARLSNGGRGPQGRAAG
jgi:DNA-binding CsgD family transcriptional regulator